MKQDLRQLVWSRAAGICEYCQLPDQYDPLTFCIDHVRPQYHHGQTVAQNLALACFNLVVPRGRWGHMANATYFERIGASRR